MSDTRVFIDFQSNAPKLKTDFDGITGSHKKATDAMKGHYDGYKVAALKDIKTVEEYRQDWAGKSAKKLVAYEHEKSIAVTNLFNQLKKDRAADDVIAQRMHENQKLRIEAELRALKQVGLERKEIQSGGVGALINQLGIGRNLTGVFGAPTMGMGVAAGLGLVAAGGVELFRKWTDAARTYEEGEDRIAVALTRTNLNLEDRRKELGYISKDVDELSKEFVKPRSEIADITATIAAFGRVGGANLKRLTEITIAAGMATGMATERFARFIGKGADPEIEARMQLIGIHVDKNATQMERLNAIEKAYGGTVDELKSRMGEGVHTWDQLVITVENAAQKFALKEFRQLAPLFEELQPKVERFIAQLSDIKLQPAIDRLKVLYHGFKDILGVLDTLTLHMLHSESGTNKGGGIGGSTADKLRFKQTNDFIAGQKGTTIGGFNFGSGPFGGNTFVPTSADADARAALEAKIESPKGSSDGKGGKLDAYHAAEAALRVHLSERIILITNEAKTEEELKQKRDAAELAFDESLLPITKLIKDGKERETVVSEVELRIADKKFQIRAKSQKETEKNDAEAYKKELAMFQGRLEGILKILKEEEKEREASEKKKKELRQKIEDWEAALIRDKQKREIAQESIRYVREKENINREVKLREDRNKLLELLDQEHADKLAEIQSQSGADMKSIFQAGVGSVFSDFNKELDENLGLAQKDGNVLVNMLRSVGNEAAKMLSKHAVSGIEKALFGDGEAAPKDKSQEGNALSPGDNSFASMIAQALSNRKLIGGPTGDKFALTDPGEYVLNSGMLASLGGVPGVEMLLSVAKGGGPTLTSAKFDVGTIDKPLPIPTISQSEASAQRREQDKQFGGLKDAGMLDPTDYMGAGIAGVLTKSFMKKEVEESMKMGIKEIGTTFAKEALDPAGAVAGAVINKTGDTIGGASNSLLGGGGSNSPTSATKANTDALKLATSATHGLSAFMQQGVTGNKNVHAGAGLAKGIFGVLSKIPGIGIGADAAELIGGGLGLFDNEGDFPGGPASGRDKNVTMFRSSANERISVYRPQPSQSQRPGMISNDGVIAAIHNMTEVLRQKNLSISNNQVYSASLTGSRSQSNISLD